MMTDADGLLAARFAVTRDGYDDSDWDDVLRRAKPAPKRRRKLVWAGGVAVAIVLAAPAFGLVRGVLPFFGAQRAPHSVQVEFSAMNTGAPAGMNPRALPGETRRIAEFYFGGGNHTLWVAPSSGGGFCFEWIGGWGGCNVAQDALTWNGDLVLPPGVAQPRTSTDPSVRAANAIRLHSLAVPTWISGYVSATTAKSVAITFSDGTTVQPEVVWVSVPINAGFFAYDIPTSHQTSANHLVNVQALDADGHVVQDQSLH